MAIETTEAGLLPTGEPDIKVSVHQLFGIESDIQVPAYSEPTDHVPPLDESYVFDPETTLAILAGFSHNRRVLIQGYHGTGKSTHIEQVAARLNWPCLRINLDSHISRIDLIGKDAIVIKDGQQVTEFRQGILPWALQNNVALCFDEYDAGRPDVMFVIQRVLEASGRLTLLDPFKSRAGITSKALLFYFRSLFPRKAGQNLLQPNDAHLLSGVPAHPVAHVLLQGQ